MCRWVTSTADCGHTFLEVGVTCDKVFNFNFGGFLGIRVVCADAPYLSLSHSDPAGLDHLDVLGDSNLHYDHCWECGPEPIITLDELPSPTRRSICGAWEHVMDLLDRLQDRYQAAGTSYHRDVDMRYRTQAYCDQFSFAATAFSRFQENITDQATDSYFATWRKAARQAKRARDYAAPAQGDFDQAIARMRAAYVCLRSADRSLCILEGAVTLLKLRTKVRLVRRDGRVDQAWRPYWREPGQNYSPLEWRTAFDRWILTLPETPRAFAAGLTLQDIRRTLETERGLGGTPISDGPQDDSDVESVGGPDSPLPTLEQRIAAAEIEAAEGAEQGGGPLGLDPFRSEGAWEFA